MVLGLAFSGLTALSLVIAGCGDASSGDDDDDDDGTGSGSTFSCCINGKGYACPDKTAFDQCAGFDVARCIEACAPSDPVCPMECHEKLAMSTPDPSDCTPDAGACSSSSSGSSSCSGTAIPCDLQMDCCEGLTCAPRQDGQPGNSCQ